MLAGVVDGGCRVFGRVGGNDGTGSGSHGWQFRFAGDNAFQDFCRAFCVVRIENPTVFGMDELRMTAVVDGGGDRESAGHGFRDDEAPVVLKRWNDEAVGCTVEHRDVGVINVSCENGIDAVLFAEIFQGRAFRTVTGEENCGIRLGKSPCFKKLA